MGVLDDMTKGITERKAKAAGPSLTPVGAEASPTQPSRTAIPDVPEVFLTNEAVADIAKDLRTQAATLVAVADGLDNLTKKPSHTPPDIKAAAQEAVKAIEQKADAKFAEEFKAKQEAAQAAVFPDLDAEVVNPVEEVAKASLDDGWVCPDHGGTNLVSLTSRKGRPYTACNFKGCSQFEK